mgnify:CR=1 FL=1
MYHQVYINTAWSLIVFLYSNTPVHVPVSSGIHQHSMISDSVPLFKHTWTCTCIIRYAPPTWSISVPLFKHNCTCTLFFIKHKLCNNILKTCIKMFYSVITNTTSWIQSIELSVYNNHSIKWKQSISHLTMFTFLIQNKNMHGCFTK